MLREDGVFARHLLTSPVLMTTICALTVIIIIRPLTLIILVFMLCMFYLMLELIKKTDTEKSNTHFYIRPMINSRISNRQKISKIKGQAKNFCISANGNGGDNNNIEANNFFKNVQQQPKRKPKMSQPLSGKKEKEELLQESSAIQLLSQIYDMTKSLLNDTREVIKMLEQDEGTSKNSTECISTELAALQKEKESQSLFPDNLSPGEAPGSLEGTQACINQRNSHGSHSTNTLDSKAGEQIKDAVDVPKEVAPFLKNNSLRRITYHFNEIQFPAASNTNNGSNNSTSTLFSIALIIGLLLKSGNEATTHKKTIYINQVKNVSKAGGSACVATSINGSSHNKNRASIKKRTMTDKLQKLM